MFEWIKEKLGIVDDSEWGFERCNKKIEQKKNEKFKKLIEPEEKKQPIAEPVAAKLPETKVNVGMPAVTPVKHKSINEKLNEALLEVERRKLDNDFEPKTYMMTEIEFKRFDKSKLKLGDFVFISTTNEIFIKTDDELTKVCGFSSSYQATTAETEDGKTVAVVENPLSLCIEPNLSEKLEQSNQRFQNNYLDYKDTYDQKQKEKDFIMKNTKKWDDPIQFDLT